MSQTKIQGSFLTDDTVNGDKLADTLTISSNTTFNSANLVISSSNTQVTSTNTVFTNNVLFNGATTITGNTTITGATTISGNIVPGTANTYTLGTSSAAFASAYLGSGVYIGGTTSANLLDDYEEGTFTPVIAPGTGSFTTTSGAGYYTKIGNQVFVFGYMKIDDIGTGSGTLGFAGLPFASSNRSFPAGNRGGLLFMREDQRTGDAVHGFISAGQPFGTIQDMDGGNFSFSTNDTFVFDGVYHTG